MTRKTRILVVALVVSGSLGLLLASTLGSRGLRIVVKNAMPEPLRDVAIIYPGGAFQIARIAPGDSSTTTIRRPLAGLWGPSREVPLTLTFTHRGTRAEPFAIRCELGWSGVRTVNLAARVRTIDSSTVVSAMMRGHYQFFPGKLIRNALDPKVGPRRFYCYRWESLRAIVIRRHDWPREVLQQLGDHALVTAVWIASLPVGSPLVLEYVHYRIDELTPGPPRPPSRFRLPFRDLSRVQYEVGATSLVQSPLLP